MNRVLAETGLVVVSLGLAFVLAGVLLPGVLFSDILLPDVAECAECGWRVWPIPVAEGLVLVAVGGYDWAR